MRQRMDEILHDIDENQRSTTDQSETAIKAMQNDLIKYVDILVAVDNHTTKEN